MPNATDRHAMSVDLADPRELTDEGSGLNEPLELSGTSRRRRPAHAAPAARAAAPTAAGVPAGDADKSAGKDAGRAKKPTMLEQAGGTKGLMYSTAPVLAFVVANSLRGLKVAVIAAFALALVIAADRLRRKESLQPALGGLFGVAVAAGVTWYTGSAKDYFLIGIWASLGGAVLFLASVAARRPLAGLIWNSARGKGNVWRADKRSRLYYDVATLVLAAIFGARFAVQQYLYSTDQVGELGFAKIAMGYPLLGLGLLVVAWAARTSDKRLKRLGLLPAKH